jgi:hypothetical protein
MPRMALLSLSARFSRRSNANRPGSLSEPFLCREQLGTEAVYRDRGPIGRGLELVEVIHAPGLRHGSLVKLTQQAVRAMRSTGVSLTT